MHRSSFVLAAAVAVLALAASASASGGPSIRITIHHQLHGCHAWAIGSGPYRASQSVHVERGTSVTIADDDVMPHQLVQQSGPKVAFRNLPSATIRGGMGLHGPFAPGMMGRMGARTTFTLTRPGVYRFTTNPGDDYMKGIVTTGADNVLKLRIVVS